MTSLYTPTLTPTQQRAAAERRARERKIARQAHPDTPIRLTRPPPAAPVPVKPRRLPVKRRQAPPADPNEITIGHIQNAVAEHFDVTVDEIQSPSMAQRLMRPRHMAMYLVRLLIRRGTGPIGFAQIGIAFNRDKVAVRYGIGRIVQIAREEAVANDIAAIMAILPAPGATAMLQGGESAGATND